MTRLNMHRMMRVTTAALTLWLLALVLWLACTNQATTAQTATNAAKKLLKPAATDTINRPRQAIMVLEAAAINHPYSH